MHCARLVVGGDQFDYPYEVSTKTFDLDTMKMFLNSVILTPNARFITNDIKYFYLWTPLKHYEYIRLQYDIIPKEIIEQYHLQAFKHDDYVYLKSNKTCTDYRRQGKSHTIIWWNTWRPTDTHQ